MKKLIYSILLIACFNSYSGQHYWQQKIKYDMSIDFDHSTHQFSGLQKITYYNNSFICIYIIMHFNQVR